MEASCPRCRGRVFHSSNSRAGIDRLLRALGFPPRRCAACGWRGYRPRSWFGARHISSEVEAVEAPATPPDPAELQRAIERRTTERKARRRNLVRAIVLATLAGSATGVVAHSCATSEAPVEQAEP